MTNKVVVTKIVGELTVIGEASSDRRDVSMQDLLDVASAATGEQTTVTSSEGVNLTILMSGPDAPAMPEPMFTPAPGEDDRYTDERNRPRGMHVGGITKAADVRKEQEAENRREQILNIFRAKLRSVADYYPKTEDKIDVIISALINESANIHRHMIMAADSDKDNFDSMRTTNEKLLREKKQLEDEIDEHLTRVADLNRQISQHATTVDKIISTRREVEKELEGCKRQNEEYQRRLKVIRDHA